MTLPKYFPDPQRTQKMIDDLLDRVRKLDPLAKQRLAHLLENEADLPMLDKVERKYREKVMESLSQMTDRDSASELSNALRTHFVRNLNLQRSYLHECVRKVLQESLDQENTSIQLHKDSQ
jgi:tRNA uridine 5-carbamoylmethylation protein Kti12